MKAYERIRELEAEIVKAANAKASLEVTKKTSRDELQVNLAAARIILVEKRIEMAQNEIKALEDHYFAEIQRARRDEKYQPIPGLTRTIIEFIG